MKKIFQIIGLTAVAFAIASCGETTGGTGPKTPEPQRVPAKAKFEFIEHKGTILGKDAPAWVGESSQSIEAMEAYKDQYVFTFEFEGKDKRGAQILAEQQQAAQAIAQQISVRIQAKYAGAEVGDKDKVDAYFENVVKSVADAKITGWKKQDDFWAYVRYFKADGQTVDREIYRVFTLYTMPKKTLDKLIADQLAGVDAAEKPKTEEERTARMRVREAFESGF